MLWCHWRLRAHPYLFSSSFSTRLGFFFRTVGSRLYRVCVCFFLQRQELILVFGFVAAETTVAADEVVLVVLGVVGSVAVRLFDG
jgi:hypothetical protein